MEISHKPRMILLIKSSFTESQIEEFISSLKEKKIFEKADVKIVKSDEINYTPFPEGESPDILGVNWGLTEEVEGILEQNPSIKWIHSFSAGVDTFLTKKILDFDAVITNAKGAFGWDLAEFVTFAMLWYVKRGQNWLDLKKERKYEKGYVGRLKDKVLGIFILFYYFFIRITILS